MLNIKQGDSYYLPIDLNENDVDIVIDDIDCVEFYVGGIRKLYPDNVSYNSETREFLVPLTQEDTLSWEANTLLKLDIRVKYSDGTVKGIDNPIHFTISDATSTEVL